MMDESTSLASWMRGIPDGTPLTTLNIPGTHNSCCVDGFLGLAETQNLDLPAQLMAGIRFVDIRLTLAEGNLCVHHDVVCTKKSYADVLAICADFLRRHPSETILMSVADESRFDNALGRFAPSRILCNLPLADGEDPGHEDRTFAETFMVKTWQHREDAALFYNYSGAPPGDHSAAPSPALTSATTLGDTRGKIVLLRRFDSSAELGFDVTYWPENQRFRSASFPVYDVEDRYQNPGDDDKFEFVVAHLEDARRGDPQDLYITFSSAVDLAARGYSRSINPRLNGYLEESPGGRLGIIVMDFFEEPPELVNNVVRTNFVTGGR